MFAAYAVSQSSSDPLSGLLISQRSYPVARLGWSVVKLRAAGMHHHAVWSLRGAVRAADILPMSLRRDAAALAAADTAASIHAVVPAHG